MKDNMLSTKEILEAGEDIAIYTRVSRDEQKIDRQNVIINQFLEKYGITDTKSFSDKKSATKHSYDEREEFSQLLEESRERNIKAIVVTDADRISRQPKEHAHLRKFFQKLNIPIILATNHKEYTEDDTIRNIIDSGLSKLEADNISARIRYGLKEKRKKGEWKGGRVPYGFKANVPHFDLIESEIEIVKAIFNQYEYGGTFYSIVNYLNKDENNSSNIKWTTNKVKSIITNPIYMGSYCYYRFTEKGAYYLQERSEWKESDCNFILKAPITKEQWERCWLIYTQSKERKPKHYTTSFYFKDILVCNCTYCNGAAMKPKDQMSKGRGSRWYIGKCKSKVRADYLDFEFEKYWNAIQEKNKTIFSKEIICFLENNLEDNLKTQVEVEKHLVVNKENLNMIVYETKKHLVFPSEKLEFMEWADEYLIALVITLQSLENKIKDLEKQKEKLSYSILKLEQAIASAQMDSEKELKYTAKFKDLLEDKRKAVLLMVKSCNYLPNERGNGSLEFVFRIPFNSVL